MHPRQGTKGFPVSRSLISRHFVSNEHSSRSYKIRQVAQHFFFSNEYILYRRLPRDGRQDSLSWSNAHIFHLRRGCLYQALYVPSRCHTGCSRCKDVVVRNHASLRVGPDGASFLSQRCHPLSGLFQLCPGAGGRGISFDASWSAIIIHNNCDGPLWQRNVGGMTDSSTSFITRSLEPRSQQHDAASSARCPWRWLLRRSLRREAEPSSQSSPSLSIVSCIRQWLLSTPHRFDLLFPFVHQAFCASYRVVTMALDCNGVWKDIIRIFCHSWTLEASELFTKIIPGQLFTFFAKHVLR